MQTSVKNLLQAEKQSSAIVEEAKKAKNDKIGLARQEAMEEVEVFRTKYEAEYREEETRKREEREALKELDVRTEADL